MSFQHICNSCIDTALCFVSFHVTSQCQHVQSGCIGPQLVIYDDHTFQRADHLLNHSRILEYLSCGFFFFFCRYEKFFFLTFFMSVLPFFSFFFKTYFFQDKFPGCGICIKYGIKKKRLLICIAKLPSRSLDLFI